MNQSQQKQGNVEKNVRVVTEVDNNTYTSILRIKKKLKAYREIS